MDTIIIDLPSLSFNKRYINTILSVLSIELLFIYLIFRNGVDKYSATVGVLGMLFILFGGLRRVRFYIKKIEQKGSEIIITYDEFNKSKSVTLNIKGLMVSLDSAFSKVPDSILIIKHNKNFKIVQYEKNGWTVEMINNTFKKLKTLSSYYSK